MSLTAIIALTIFISGGTGLEVCRVVIIVSGLMAWREVRQLGWPTYEGSAEWNAEMKNVAEGDEL